MREMSPFIKCEKPSQTPTTSIPDKALRMVAAPSTALIPGAGPPPTSIPSFLLPRGAFMVVMPGPDAQGS